MLRILACVARQLSEGQRAAIRQVRQRRAALGFNQRQAAEKAGVSLRTLGSFENGHSWPDDTTLSQLERLALDWPVGHISDLAIQHHHDGQLVANPSSLVELAVGRVVTVLRQVPSPQREKAWQEIVENVEGAMFPSVSDEEADDLLRRADDLGDDEERGA